MFTNYSARSDLVAKWTDKKAYNPLIFLILDKNLGFNFYSAVFIATNSNNSSNFIYV